ncbi:RDD family protein [Desulfosporosinus youngiae]|uniref:RDD domain-containing protein n=1 Tax=Desulfosporosinus youngiae DSM 17734 TaxID=768710 RepID=H5Y5J3_9FIRM|nr:RDD family protein [Desulfosporosinus youngiae]EHQ90580.1 hypothetical protein DesyoDRAFT_3576 [Desulfosporosinus youngiae DSM 17734]
MKQSEYLRELKENLEGKLAPETVKDILADYESFFLAGREEGKTDDEISDGLGSPAFLAKSLLEGQAATENGLTVKPDKHIAHPGRRLCAYLIDAAIAFLPVLVLTSFLGSAIMSFYMFIFYPAPLSGASVFLSYAAYGEYKTTESYPVEVQVQPETNREIVREGGSNPERVQKDFPKPTAVKIAAAWFALAFYLLYSLVATLLFRGQTVGKKLLRLKVRRSDTGPVSSGSIFLRELLMKTVINSIPLVPLISLVTILYSEEHKTLHDMLADTIVVNV